jgi:penicillin-binding protein 1A
MDKKEQPNKDLEKTQTYIIKNKKVKGAKKPKKEKMPKKEKKPKKPSKHPKLKKAIKITVLVTFLLMLIGGGIAVGWVTQLLKDARLGLDKLVIKYENSIVKNINGETIAVLNGDENREVVPLSDMAEYLPVAFVSIEDERFYDHFGIDVKRTAGAAVQYVLRRGDYSFGGSTITQQLVKNLTNEKEGTVSRKITEMARAYYIEKELSKTQILELYLNLIFMGGTSYGVEVGSIYYFNKSCSELSLAECAFLAGINDSPNMYDPFSKETEDVEGVKTRAKIVLNKMKELGRIKTEEEYTQAIAEVEAGLKFKQGKITENVFSYHTDAALQQIINELMAENGWDYETAKLHLFSSGYTIYTTENPDIQKTMEEEFAKDKYNVRRNGKDSQAGMVIIDHKTGQVLAAVGKLGDRKNKDSFGYNRATQSTKQVGSSMKPIAVLAPAIDQGVITAATGYDDVSYSVGGTTFKNYDFSSKGMINMRRAVALSQNIPFLKAMVDLTPAKSMEFLESVGIDNLVEADNYIGLGLGRTDEWNKSVKSSRSICSNCK